MTTTHCFVYTEVKLLTAIDVEEESPLGGATGGLKTLILGVGIQPPIGVHL